MKLVCITCGACHGEGYAHGERCDACHATGYVLAAEVSPAVFVESPGGEPVDVVDLANAAWGEE